MRAATSASLALFCLLGAVSPARAVDTGQLLVKYRAGATDEAIRGLEAGLGLAAVSVSPWTGVHLVSLGSGAAASDALRALSASPWVDFAEVNGTVTAAFLPNDPFYSLYQWNMNTVGMPAAWDVNPGGHASTVVAVVDTGVAYENNGPYRLAPDLAGTSFVQGFDFVNNDNHPNDDQGHGTHVTGTIAQTTNNAIGVAGIAFQCSIMPVKVLNSSGSGTFQNVADGITYAADHGANVINMSLGSTTPSTAIEQAVNYAHSKGVTVVAASGNDNAIGVTAVDYPAAYPVVIAVGATRFDNTVTWYSNKGPALDLVAPGGDLSVDQNGDNQPDGVLQNDFNLNTKNFKQFGYWFLTGTSMATPHVVGVAALIYDMGVHDPDLIRTILEHTATDLEAPGFDNDTAWGLLNAAAALELAATFPHPGDANKDGKVDGGDLAIWQENYDPLGLNANTFELGDFNGDGKVDGGDLALWQQNYAPLGYLSQSLGASLGFGAVPGPSGAAGAQFYALDAVPEPASLALILLGAPALFLRRRSYSAMTPGTTSV